MWVSTIGTGVHVYSAATKREVARWEGAAKVFKLVFIEHTSSVLALAHRGTHLFSVEDVSQPLVPRISSDINNNDDLTAVTLAGCYSNTEVWALSSAADGNHIIILDCSGVMVAEICKQIRTGRRVRYIAAHTGTNHVFVSDRNYLEMWEVQERRMVAEFDCSEACKEMYSSPDCASHNSADNMLRSSHVTSLLYLNEAIYVGTHGGAILVLSTDLRPLTSYRASAGASRCLMGVRSIRRIKSLSKFFSRREVVAGGRSNSLTTETSSPTPNEVLHLTSSLGNSEDRGIVISFGETYLGATSYSSNVPPSLNPPGDPPSCNTAPYPYLLTKLPKNDTKPPNVIFTWSAYCPTTCENGEDGGDQLENDIDEL